MNPQKVIESIPMLNAEIADGARHEMILGYFVELKRQDLGNELNLEPLILALNHIDGRVVSLGIRIFGLFPSKLTPKVVELIFESNATFAVLEFISLVHYDIELDEAKVIYYFKQAANSPNRCEFDSVLKLVPFQKWQIQPEWFSNPERRVDFLSIRKSLNILEWESVLRCCLVPNCNPILGTKCVKLLRTEIGSLEIVPSAIEQQVSIELRVETLNSSILLMAVHSKLASNHDFKVEDNLIQFCLNIMRITSTIKVHPIKDATILGGIQNFIVGIPPTQLERMKNGLQKSIINALELSLNEMTHPDQYLNQLLELNNLCFSKPLYHQTLNLIITLFGKLDYSIIQKLMGNPMLDSKLILKLCAKRDISKCISELILNQDWCLIDDMLQFVINSFQNKELDFETIQVLHPKLLALTKNDFPAIRAHIFDLIAIFVRMYNSTCKYIDEYADILKSRFRIESDSEVLASMLNLSALLNLPILSAHELCEYAHNEDYNVKTAMVLNFQRIYRNDRNEFLNGPYLTVIETLLDDFCWIVRRHCLDLVAQIQSHSKIDWLANIDLKREYERCDPKLLNDGLALSSSILQEFESLGEGNNCLQCYDC